MRHCAATVFTPVFATLLFTSFTSAQEWARVSPFTEVEVIGDAAEVVFEGQRYKLVSIEGISSKEILAWCRKNYDNRWEDRFAMDLVEVMSGMNVKLADTVQLELRGKADGAIRKIERAALTRANRDAVAAAQMERPWKRITAAEMQKVLDEFERALEERWSYLEVSSFDHRGMIGAIRKRAAAGMAIGDFPPELQKVFGRGIDGHAQIAGWDRFAPPGWLPFLIEPAGDRYVAFAAEPRKFLSEGHPYIESIDGRAMDEWLKAASVYIPDGSPQLVRQRALGQVRSIQFLRKEMGLERKQQIDVGLRSADGNRKTIQVNVAETPLSYGVWPHGQGKGKPPEGIEYLRLVEMISDPGAGQIIDAAFAKARSPGVLGLIIDVRDNGGGARDPLRHVAAHLMKGDDRPRVVNAAAHRLHPEHAKMMESRFLYPENSRQWTAAEREAIGEFKKNFKPQLTPAREKFSDWHYLVLSPGRGNAPRFDKPVVILMNARCFSATDIFLASLKGMPRVTLVGTASGGGSANVNTVTLGHPLIRARLGTMISFQADGKLFDGDGVDPDVKVEPAAEFFIGGEDNQLAEAVKIIQRGAKAKPGE